MMTWYIFYTPGWAAILSEKRPCSQRFAHPLPKYLSSSHKRPGTIPGSLLGMTTLYPSSINFAIIFMDK